MQGSCVQTFRSPNRLRPACAPRHLLQASRCVQAQSSDDRSGSSVQGHRCPPNSASFALARIHTTPRACSCSISASLTPRWPKISALCWPSLGGDSAHPHTLADPDRGANVRHPAQFRVARVLHQAAVLHLRVGEHLRISRPGRTAPRRTLGQRIENRDRVFGPAADPPQSGIAARRAVSEIVEAHIGPPAAPGMLCEKRGLGAGHVGAEAAEEHDPRCGDGEPAVDDCCTILTC